jgi:hypothetical protein
MGPEASCPCPIPRPARGGICSLTSLYSAGDVYNLSEKYDNSLYVKYVKSLYVKYVKYAKILG